MQWRYNRRFVWAALGGAWMLGMAGCSTRSPAEFVPVEANARNALDKVLTAWQNGQKLERLEGSPNVDPADTRWMAGAKLTGYEVLNTEPGNGPVWFTVKLKMRPPAGEKTVRYAVFGNDPLQVYSEEEFKKLNGGT
jgi:hypothetical protein